MSQLRREVLRQFKNLHRARLAVFDGDERTLNEARKQINEGFKKNKNVTNEDSIKELVKFARDVEIELKTNVVQAVEKEPGVYEVKIRPETPKLDNVMFNENAVIPKQKGPKCGSKSEAKS